MRDPFALLALNLLVAGIVAASVQGQGRPRARDLGLEPGVFPPGPLNAITDVAGVRGRPHDGRRGRRCPDRRDRNSPARGQPLPGEGGGGGVRRQRVRQARGLHAGGRARDDRDAHRPHQHIERRHRRGRGRRATRSRRTATRQVQSVNALVGETNDGGLNDIRGRHVTKEHVLAAIRSAGAGTGRGRGRSAPGTGTRCFGWKGGNRNGVPRASRRGTARYRLGVLVQTNFGGVLTIGGAPVGRELGRYAFSPPAPRSGPPMPVAAPDDGDGSCMIVVATDAPLDARDLKRLAARAVFGLARTGSSYSNGSGDFVDRLLHFTGDAHRAQRDGAARAGDPAVGGDLAAVPGGARGHRGGCLQLAVPGDDDDGSGQTVEALPVDRVKEILKRYGVVAK